MHLGQVSQVEEEVSERLSGFRARSTRKTTIAAIPACCGPRVFCIASTVVQSYANPVTLLRPPAFVRR